MTLVYDIETCPQPVEALTDRQARRLEMEGGRIAERDADLSIEQAARKAASLHPQLGWICCISFAVVGSDGAVEEVHSCTAAAPNEERAALEAFWCEILTLAPAKTVTFNGKYFDAPFLKLRSIRHQIPLPKNADVVLSTHRWQNRPHLDLAHILHPVRLGLDDLCELLDVPSPKGSMTGAGVALAVEAGRIADVARYCEADVVATAHCVRALGDLRAL